MATLITGGTSKIGLGIATRLQSLGKESIFATRSPQKVPEGFKHSKFDWDDPSTFPIAFNEHPGIENVYLLPPLAVAEPLDILKPFIDLAVEKGVRKFVLISATCASVGAHDVLLYLEKLGLDYFALRPTWYIENIFSFHSYTVKAQGELISVVPDGKIPFVSVEDIAQAAVDFLTGVINAKQRFIIGPQSYTYNEIAVLLQDHVGKPVTHKAITPEEQVARYKAFGASEDYSRKLVEEEVNTNDGREDRLFQNKEVYVGNHSLLDILEAKRDFWKD